jgi:hypothetical protein
MARLSPYGIILQRIDTVAPGVGASILFNVAAYLADGESYRAQIKWLDRMGTVRFWARAGE